MGLLDSLAYGSQGGYGGLLDGLFYPSPLLKQQEVPQPQYDAMGNYTGVTQQPADPFGPIPQMGQPPQQQSVFNQGASPLIGTAPGTLVGATQSAQGGPSTPAAASPAPQVGAPLNLTPQIASNAPQQSNATDFSAQSQMPQQALPPAFGRQGESNFAVGLRNLGNPGGLLNKVADAVQGFSTGQRTDAQGVAQQNLKAQYDTLVPLVGPQKAMLAVLNPEAGKTILAQALEKKQYGFTKLDNDTLLRTDPLKGTAEVAYGGGGPGNTVTGPDGKEIPIPPGVDPKTFRNEISRATADAATGKKTEVQAAAEQFANRMESAEKSFAKVGNEGLGLSGATQNVTGAIPAVGNFLKTEGFQKMEQAKREWVTALLRKESGAAIGKDEYTQYDRQFFPQPGDGPDVVAQKANARRIATDALKKSAGPSYRAPTENNGGVRKYNPATGRIE
jgi:hypothetical protein